MRRIVASDDEEGVPVPSPAAQQTRAVPDQDPGPQRRGQVAGAQGSARSVGTRTSPRLAARTEVSTRVQSNIGSQRSSTRAQSNIGSQRRSSLKRRSAGKGIFGSDESEFESSSDDESEFELSSDDDDEASKSSPVRSLRALLGDSDDEVGSSFYCRLSA